MSGWILLFSQSSRSTHMSSDCSLTFGQTLLAHWIGPLKAHLRPPLTSSSALECLPACFNAVLSRHFHQPAPPPDSAASIGLRSSVAPPPPAPHPPACRQTRVGDEGDTRSQRYLRVEALKAHKARRAAVCLYKRLSGCLMETLLHLLRLLRLLLETLRNECPRGSSELLRCCVIVGVLKRLQTMSVTETSLDNL